MTAIISATHYIGVIPVEAGANRVKIDSVSAPRRPSSLFVGHRLEAPARIR
jgi:hypothetical protein